MSNDTECGCPITRAACVEALYELYELYYRITQITGKPVFYIVVQKYI